MVSVYFILQHWAKVYWHVQNPGWQVCVNWWPFFLITSVTDIITLFGGKMREHDRMNEQLLKLVGGGNIEATCHSRTPTWKVINWFMKDHTSLDSPLLSLATKVPARTKVWSRRTSLLLVGWRRYQEICSQKDIYAKQHSRRKERKAFITW